MLDTHTISSFSGGQYLVWSITGHVVFRVTSITGANAVISGLFWGGAGATSPVNQAPVVNAGSNQAITLPARAVLNGTVNDDGLPYNSLTLGWTRVSGPGSVTFSASTAAQTTAAFSAAGVYVLQLVASDGVLSGSSQMTVTVNVAVDLTGPSLTQVAASNLTTTGATISWTSDEPATGEVLYGTTSSLGSNSGANATLVTSHTVTLSALTAGTAYYYAVRSADAAGNTTTSAVSTFSTASQPSTAAVVYVTTDAATKGTWKGVYGGEGGGDRW